jgi:hypothetical protein
MCHYVTAVLPELVAPPSAQAAAEAHQLRFEPVANAFVGGQLRRGEGYFRLGTGQCDCGTPLGARSAAPADDPPSDRELAKLRKKGWSAAKIERWLGERRLARDRRARKNAAHDASLGPALEGWVAFLRAVLEAGDVASVGLLLHWYRGGVDSERIRLASRRGVPLRELSADLLLGIEEDVLYDFQRA